MHGYVLEHPFVERQILTPYGAAAVVAVDADFQNEVTARMINDIMQSLRSVELAATQPTTDVPAWERAPSNPACGGMRNPGVRFIRSV